MSSQPELLITSNAHIIISDDEEEEDVAKVPAQNHNRTPSDLSDFTLFEIHDHQVKEQKNVEDAVIPSSTLVVVAESEKFNDQFDDTYMNEFDLEDDVTFRIRNWGGKRFYSDYIKAGMDYKKKQNPAMTDLNVIMLFESPSSSATDASFYNKNKFRFHDWPPPKSSKSKHVLGPNRYASMNGDTFPIYLRDGKPPTGLEEHWESVLPGVPKPNFVSKIDMDRDTVYAYLPVEELKHHVNDPQTHYHLAGKDAIHLMTQKTTKILSDTRTKRPCVVKTTHSMGSKGIFIINDDQDEAELEKFLVDSGNPSYVVVDFVDIVRNVACHFFMHPNGSVVWFGSNENHREPDGKFSTDSYLLMDHQDALKEMQLPFVEEVVRYCRAVDFWGFCGVDVLFDSSGAGYLVDINPRVTGSCPALMSLQLLSKEHGFSVGIFRRTGDNNYHGTAEQLMKEVSAYNMANEGKSMIIIQSMWESPEDNYQNVKMNIGVYGNDLGECKEFLNHFAKPAKN